MSLYKYILKRILLIIPTLIGILIITFFITRALPGDPVAYRLPLFRVSLEDILAERARLGLDKPVIVQFFVFVSDMLSGNWGYSFTVLPDTPVWDIILERLPRTLEFMFYSMTIAIFFGTRLGRISGAHQNKGKDVVSRIFTYFLVSAPAFVLVIFLIQISMVSPIKIFPTYGYKSTVYPLPPTITHIYLLDCLLSGEWYLASDYLWHLIVPLSAVTLVQLVVIVRQTRSGIIDTLNYDYINTARVKGCSEKDVIKKHAFKNALIPAIMVASMGFPVVLGGMIAVEEIYQMVGMGALFYDAVGVSDYPIIIASIYIFALVVVIVNLIGDVLIAIIDPRIRLK
ncbi:MAG: ABC transporter permease [Promethearchaeota archaeon]